MSETIEVARAPRLGDATASTAYWDVLTQLYERAAGTFAPGTALLPMPEGALSGPERTLTTATIDPEVLAEYSKNPELRAIEELRAWLRISYRDVATVAGLGSPSLIYYWRDKHRKGLPVRVRASTVEQLWRIYSLVHAVAEALEGADRGHAVQLWARQPTDGATPLDHLMTGEVDQFERRADELLFPESAVRTSVARLAAVDDDEEDPNETRRGRTRKLKDRDFG